MSVCRKCAAYYAPPGGLCGNCEPLPAKRVDQTDSREPPLDPIDAAAKELAGKTKKGREQ